MFFRQTENKDSDDGVRNLTANGVRVHSIACTLRGRGFRGRLVFGGSTYDFTYTPSSAAIAGRRLRLSGRLAVEGPGAAPRARDNVKATLVAAQGGIGAAPPRRGQPVSPANPSRLPEVESTGASSFCGAMYLQFEALSGSALGVAADISRVQLNVRFAPVNDSERTLQGVYSSIVDSLCAKKPDVGSAAASVGELNKLLTEG
jgi:hypothetical protein